MSVPAGVLSHFPLQSAIRSSSWPIFAPLRLPSPIEARDPQTNSPILLGATWALLRRQSTGSDSLIKTTVATPPGLRFPPFSSSLFSFHEPVPPHSGIGYSFIPESARANKQRASGFAQELQSSQLVSLFIRNAALTSTTRPGYLDIVRMTQWPGPCMDSTPFDWRIV
jgi:hypothetical protein